MDENVEDATDENVKAMIIAISMDENVKVTVSSRRKRETRCN